MCMIKKNLNQYFLQKKINNQHIFNKLRFITQNIKLKNMEEKENPICQQPKRIPKGCNIASIIVSIILIIVIITKCSNCSDQKKQGNKYYITNYSTNLFNSKSEIDIDSIYETSDSAAIISAFLRHTVLLGLYYENMNTGGNKAIYNRPDSFSLINSRNENITNKEFKGRDSIIQAMFREHVELNKSIYAEKEIYAQKKIAERDSIVRNSIVITSTYLTRPNSAGGCDAHFYYKNLSDKTIKYLDWTGIVFNAVGDVVSCEARNQSEFGGRTTGPVKKSGKNGGYWDCMIYNSSARKLKITNIYIEYMDGSTLELKDEDIDLIQKK